MSRNERGWKASEIEAAERQRILRECEVYGHAWTVSFYSRETGRFDERSDGSMQCAWCKAFQPARPLEAA